jgi:hypothetical protein
MRILYATFKTPAEFLARLQVSKDEPGLLAVATRARFEKGETAILEIGFPRMPNRVLMRVVARGSSGRGALYEVAPGEESKLDFLVAIAAGKVKATVKRHHRRFPIRLPAKYVVEGDKTHARGDGETGDIGAGGLFLRTARTFKVGTRVTITLDPCDDSPELVFAGTVVTDQHQGGVGVRFDKLPGTAMKRLRQLIRTVKLSGKLSEWEDASVL